MEQVFQRHRNVALSFSGGKDSLALLHLMRPYWDHLTVYWLNPGNPFPETVELMDRVRAMVPNFKEVAGRQPEVIAADGWPSDVVPQGYTTDGNTVFGATPFKVQSRLSCCFRALMWPAFEAMRADGVDCILRGKREDEADKTRIQSGYVADGIELVFPLMHWSAQDVVNYLHAVGVALPKFYEHAGHSLDCMDCTAWWGEGLSRYLKHEHPVHFAEYSRRVGLIKSAVAEQLSKCEV
jgi:phosphoadenosine phosphosulfate reductase